MPTILTIGKFSIFLILGLLVACAAEPPLDSPSGETPQEEPPTAPPNTPEPDAETAPGPELGGDEKQPERPPTVDAPPAVVGEVPEELLTAVLDDLMTRTGADRTAIEITRAEEAIWNDGSLGCGKPGEVYTQAPVQGYWLNFKVQGQLYDYRANDRGYFVYCASPLPGPGSAPTG